MESRQHSQTRSPLDSDCWTPDLTITLASVPFAAELVSRMYAGRADSVRIGSKSYREDLSLDTFCLQSFDAIDLAFRPGCVRYNLPMGFRGPCFRPVGLSDGCGLCGTWSSWSEPILCPRLDGRGSGSRCQWKSAPSFSCGHAPCLTARNLLDG